MNRHVLLMSLACWGLFGTMPAPAAETDANAARTKMFFVRQGDGATSGYRTIEDLATTDRLVFVLFGTGRATLTIADADEPGDTITASGTLKAVQWMTFNAAATSPDQIVQTLLTTNFGVLTVDVGYSQVVNGLPGRYYYKLEF